MKKTKEIAENTNKLTAVRAGTIAKPFLQHIACEIASFCLLQKLQVRTDPQIVIQNVCCVFSHKTVFKLVQPMQRWFPCDTLALQNKNISESIRVGLARICGLRDMSLLFLFLLLYFPVFDVFYVIQKILLAFQPPQKAKIM